MFQALIHKKYFIVFAITSLVASIFAGVIGVLKSHQKNHTTQVNQGNGYVFNGPYYGTPLTPVSGPAKRADPDSKPTTEPPSVQGDLPRFGEKPELPKNNNDGLGRRSPEKDMEKEPRNDQEARPPQPELPAEKRPPTRPAVPKSQTQPDLPISISGPIFKDRPDLPQTGSLRRPDVESHYLDEPTATRVLQAVGQLLSPTPKELRLELRVSPENQTLLIVVADGIDMLFEYGMPDRFADYTKAWRRNVSSGAFTSKADELINALDESKIYTGNAFYIRDINDQVHRFRFDKEIRKLYWPSAHVVVGDKIKKVGD